MQLCGIPPNPKARETKVIFNFQASSIYEQHIWLYYFNSKLSCAWENKNLIFDTQKSIPKMLLCRQTSAPRHERSSLPPISRWGKKYHGVSKLERVD